MDRTAVSGTAGTGSIPVGGASRSQTLRLAANSGARRCAPPQLAAQGFAHSTELAAQGFAHSTDLSWRLALLFILFLDFFDELVLLLRIFENAVIVVAGAEDVYDHE